jgi:hypothetical protein
VAVTYRADFIDIRLIGRFCWCFSPVKKSVKIAIYIFELAEWM